MTLTTESQRVLLYVGTYTRPAPYLKTTNGQGIYIYSLNLASGELTPVSEMLNIDNPSYLTISHNRRYLYATSEVWLWQEGMITAYSIDAQTGALTYINKQPTLGSINAYASVDHADHFVMVANYWDGESVVIFPLRADGGVLPASDSVFHEGKGANEARQDKSHAHCILPDPTNTYVYSADLGIDQIVCYRLDHNHGRLHRHDSLQLPDGTGPRHMVFHPNNKFAYVIGELNSSITVLSVDSATGALAALQSVPTLPAGVAHETSHCSDIQIHPSGKFVYGGNRGHDSLVIYAADSETGRLTYVGHQPTLGQTPRNFAIDPTGTYMLVGNQDSDTIVIFRINQETGTLDPTGQVASVPTPVCLKLITL
ncbi:MAG: lactonase family protein [Anaerolineae bacterium]|nr:lactonase family protein [Anaerolineae bacterium]